MLFSLQQLSILDVFSLEMYAFIGEQLEEEQVFLKKILKNGILLVIPCPNDQSSKFA